MGSEARPAPKPFTSDPRAVLQPQLGVAQVTGPLSWAGRCYKFPTVLQRRCSGSGVAQVAASFSERCGAATQCVSRVGVVRTKVRTCHAAVLSAFCCLFRFCVYVHVVGRDVIASTRRAVCLSGAGFVPGPVLQWRPGPRTRHSSRIEVVELLPTRRSSWRCHCRPRSNSRASLRTGLCSDVPVIVPAVSTGIPRRSCA